MSASMVITDLPAVAGELGGVRIGERVRHGRRRERDYKGKGEQKVLHWGSPFNVYAPIRRESLTQTPSSGVNHRSREFHPVG